MVVEIHDFKKRALAVTSDDISLSLSIYKMKIVISTFWVWGSLKRWHQAKATTLKLVHLFPPSYNQGYKNKSRLVGEEQSIWLYTLDIFVVVTFWIHNKRSYTETLQICKLLQLFV